MKARVFCFIDHAHRPATDLFENAVMRDGLSDEPIRTGHDAAILGCAVKTSQRTCAPKAERRCVDLYDRQRQNRERD